GLVYDAIRRVRSVPASGRAAMLALADSDAQLAALFDGASYGPAAITADEPRAETGLATPALIKLFDPLVTKAEHAAMLARAPLDLRANRLRSSRDELAMIFPDGEAINDLTDGWRLPGETAAVQNPAYAEGQF